MSLRRTHGIPRVGGMGVPMNESDRRQRVISSTPRLSTDEVASRSFAKGVRGFSETEVRAFLKRVSEELALARGREQELESAIDALEEQVRAPRPLSEQELLDALGEETARLVALRARGERRHPQEGRGPGGAAGRGSGRSRRTHPRRGNRAAPDPYRGSRGEDGRARLGRRDARHDGARSGQGRGRDDSRPRPPAGARDARRGEVGARARARRSRAAPRS